jgi:hypothetical protein
MYLNVEEACTFTMHTPQLMQRGINTALNSLRQCSGNWLTNEQKEYADLSLQIQVLGACVGVVGGVVGRVVSLVCWSCIIKPCGDTVRASDSPVHAGVFARRRSC